MMQHKLPEGTELAEKTSNILLHYKCQSGFQVTPLSLPLLVNLLMKKYIWDFL